MAKEAILVRIIETTTIVSERVIRVMAERQPGDMHRRSPLVNRTKKYRNGLADRAEKMALQGDGEIIKENVKTSVDRSIPLLEMPYKPVVSFDCKEVRKRLGICSCGRK